MKVINYNIRARSDRVAVVDWCDENEHVSLVPQTSHLRDRDIGVGSTGYTLLEIEVPLLIYTGVQYPTNKTDGRTLAETDTRPAYDPSTRLNISLGGESKIWVVGTLVP